MSYYGCDMGHIAAAGASVYTTLLYIQNIKFPFSFIKWNLLNYNKYLYQASTIETYYS